MKNRIKEKLPTHTLVETNSENLYIVDYTNLQRGGVEMHIEKPEDIDAIHIENKQLVDIIFDGFEHNALPIEPGIHSSQCECVLFPNTCEEKDWVLFIELKYPFNEENALRDGNNYPKKMISQIIETVTYFRINEILLNSQKVSAIVTFPNLLQDFSNFIFNGENTIENILCNYKIRIRATNSASVLSNKRIKLNSM